MRLEVPEENVRVPLAEFQAVWTRAESLFTVKLNSRLSALDASRK